MVFSCFLLFFLLYLTECGDDCLSPSTICICTEEYAIRDENEKCTSNFKDAFASVNSQTKQVLIMEGEYSEIVQIDSDFGSAENPIEIRPYENHSVTITDSSAYIFEFKSGNYWLHSGNGILRIIEKNGVTLLRNLNIQYLKIGPLEILVDSYVPHVVPLIYVYYSCQTTKSLIEGVEIKNPDRYKYRAIIAHGIDTEDCGATDERFDIVEIKNCVFEYPNFVFLGKESYGVTITGNYILADDFGDGLDDEAMIKYHGVFHCSKVINNVFVVSNFDTFIIKTYVSDEKYVSDEDGECWKFYIDNNLFDCTSNNGWPLMWHDNLYTLTGSVNWDDVKFENNILNGDCTGEDYLIQVGTSFRKIKCDGCVARYNYRTQDFDDWAQSSLFGSTWSSKNNYGVNDFKFYALGEKPIPYYQFSHDSMPSGYQGVYVSGKSPTYDYENELRSTNVFLAGPFQGLICENENYNNFDFCDSCRNEWNFTQKCLECIGNWDDRLDCSECNDDLGKLSKESYCTSCRNQWLEPDCLECKVHWDPTKDCNECYGNRDNSTDCLKCKNFYIDEDNDCGTCPDFYDINSDCSECISNYDIQTNCTKCINVKYDPSKNCEECLGRGDPRTNCSTCLNNWKGDACDQCDSHFDVDSDCRDCSFPWINKENNCNDCYHTYDNETCTKCINNYDINQYCLSCLGNWDINKECTECLPRYDKSTNCETCLNHYSINSGCSQCEDGYDINTDCTECANMYYGDNCQKCPNKANNNSDCSECIDGWTGDDCEKPICYGIESTDSSSCGEAGICIGINNCNCINETYHGFMCNERIYEAKYSSENEIVLIYEMSTKYQFYDGNNYYGTFNCSDLISFPEDKSYIYDCTFKGTISKTNELVISIKNSDINEIKTLIVTPITKKEDKVILVVESYNTKTIFVVIVEIALPIIGIVILIIFFVGTILLFWLFCSLKKSKNIKKVIEDVGGVEELKIINAQTKASKVDDIDLKIRNRMFQIPFKDVKFIKTIGQGGSGAVVYFSVWNGMKVATKLFKTSIFSSTEDFSDFQKEIVLSLGVSHNNIIRVFGIIQKSSRLGIVMEYCEKGDLQSFIRKIELGVSEKMEVKQKLKFSLEILSAICYLHGKGIIHRDLKTENVLLNSTLSCKLMDFGVSRVINDQSNSQSRMTQRVGTSYYMSPQVFLGEKYTEKCDIFSYSIVLWEIIHEKTEPYEGRKYKLSQNIEFIVSKDPNFRPKINKSKFIGIEWLLDIIRQSWSHLESDRPNSTEILEIFNKKDPNILLKDRTKSFISRRKKTKNFTNEDLHNLTI